MKIPPDASIEWRRVLQDIDEKIRKLGASNAANADLSGKRFVNAGKAQRFGEYTTLEQVLDIVRQSVGKQTTATTTPTDDTPDTASPPDGGGGGGGGPGPPPPPSTGTCTSQPLSSSLPGWFYNALFTAGQPTNSNCFDPALLDAIEADCNANDFTLQRDSGCNVRGRLEHQANHALWTTFCGHPNCGINGAADYTVDVVVTNSDGTVSWGWV